MFNFYLSPPVPFFFFNDTATTEIYTLSLHDALPLSRARLRLLPLPAGALGAAPSRQRPHRRLGRAVGRVRALRDVAARERALFPPRVRGHPPGPGAAPVVLLSPQPPGRPLR